MKNCRICGIALNRKGNIKYCKDCHTKIHGGLELVPTRYN